TEKVKGQELKEDATTDFSKALHEDENDLQRRTVAATEQETANIEGLAEPLELKGDRRGGRAGTLSRWLDRDLHVESRDYGLQTNLTVPTRRGNVVVDAHMTTGNQILDDIKAAGNLD